MKLNNRNKESSFSPLNDHHEKKRVREHRGEHVILKRDKRTRIVDRLRIAMKLILFGRVTDGLDVIEAVIKEVEK